MDRITQERRSALMAKVRSAGTDIELRVRRALHKAGYRYRVNARGLPGRPDVVFKGRRKAIFVHGCFWHGHEGCKRSALPTSRRDFWAAKIARNQRRDADNCERLVGLGWSVLTVWQCEMENDGELAARLADFVGPSSIRR
ncbi:MAG TPA: very short patch repair endonuclease [Methyloceanibacter sp.]|nr:very short patch repair endonuclease [Methyloceanibacter sp.]